ncbi:MAG: hypothetical protein HY726_16685 [Candidatus Rokubacteria bacterium]|nr:hypothetical protein [Candidatus Rokubacteria bacterium]
MGRFTSFLRGFLKPLRDTRGATLYETTAVVAMTAVMAAVAIPMALQSIENSKVSRAANEVLTISNAISKFQEHTGRIPGEMEIKRAGSSLCFLQSGVPGTDPSTSTLLPQVDSLGTASKPFDASEFLGRPCNTITATNVLNLNSFLVQKPSESDYPGWNGPYMEPIASDGWDRAYIFNPLPLMFASKVPDPGLGQSADTAGKIGYGWVLTVGPDRLLQTALTMAQLDPNGDDIGRNLGARIIKSAGGATAASQ